VLRRNQDIAAADELLLKWERRSTLAAIAHSRSANRCATWDVILGSISVIFTAVVGTSVFAALQEDLDTTARVAVAFFTVGAAISTAVHVFAAFPARRAAYEAASRGHAALRRRIEDVRARLEAGEGMKVWEMVEAVRTEMNELAKASPNAARRIWNQTRRQMKGEFTRWERFWAKLRGVPLDQVGRQGQADGPAIPVARSAS
jgi:hypothetical protein